MNNAATPPCAEYFDAETLKELRDSARVYQKLDLTYLAAGGAIVTALKLSNNALLEVGARQSVIVLAFLTLLAADTFIEQFVFSEWLAAKTNATKRHANGFIKGLVALQPLFHLIFIGLVISGALGFAKGFTSFQDTIRARAAIQDATEIFLSERRRLPNSIEELVAFSPRVSRPYETLEHQPIRFEPDPKDQYRIVFSGQDNVLGTEDDDVVTSLVRLTELLNGMAAKECN